jgi:ribose transport system substrate-binding protein
MEIQRIGRWLGLAALLLATAGCQRDDGKLRVAFVTNNAEDFWSMAEKGTSQAEADINAANKDFQVVVDFRKPPTGNSSEQQEIIENLLGKGIKGLAVSPNNAANMVPFYKKVVAKKVALVMQDNDLPNNDHALRQCYIGTQNYHAGLAAGKLVIEACPEGGKIAIFVGKADAQNAIERRQGVLDYLADPDPKHLNHKEMGEVTPWDATDKKIGKFVLVDTRIDEASGKKCQESAENLLGRHPDVACLIGLWEYNPPALLRAIKQSRINKAPKVVAFDENLQTLEGIMSDDCYATVVQNPYEFGYQSIKFLVGAARGKKTEELLKGLKDSRTGADLPADAKNRVFVPHRVITKANVDAFDAEVRKLKGVTPRVQK